MINCKAYPQQNLVKIISFPRIMYECKSVAGKFYGQASNTLCSPARRRRADILKPLIVNVEPCNLLQSIRVLLFLLSLPFLYLRS